MTIPLLLFLLEVPKNVQEHECLWENIGICICRFHFLLNFFCSFGGLVSIFLSVSAFISLARSLLNNLHLVCISSPSIRDEDECVFPSNSIVALLPYNPTKSCTCLLPYSESEASSVESRAGSNTEDETSSFTTVSEKQLLMLEIRWSM